MVMIANKIEYQYWVWYSYCNSLNSFRSYHITFTLLIKDIDDVYSNSPSQSSTCHSDQPDTFQPVAEPVQRSHQIQPVQEYCWKHNKLRKPDFNSRPFYEVPLRDKEYVENAAMPSQNTVATTNYSSIKDQRKYGQNGICT